MAKKFDNREIVKQVDKELLDDLGQTAFAIARNLIFASPVGNPSLWQNPKAPPGYVGGHFRRNWIVSSGGFNSEEIAGEDSNGAATLSKARSQINQYEGSRDLGLKLVIQNNVPYANRLAGGWSAQAPPGWVDEAINAGLNIPGGKRELD